MRPLYLLDANVFIQANHTNYSPDVFPGFWKWLDREFKNGQISSIDAIYKELVSDRMDYTAEWATKRKETGFFLDNSDENTQIIYKKIVNKIYSEDMLIKSRSAISS